jgi:hypothetical protein
VSRFSDRPPRTVLDDQLEDRDCRLIAVVALTAVTLTAAGLAGLLAWAIAQWAGQR